MHAVVSSARLGHAASANVHVSSRRRPRMHARAVRASSSSSSPSAGSNSTAGGTDLPKREWSEMTTNEFERLDKDRVIALLPVGAT